MSLLGLDPQSIVERVKASPSPVHAPTWSESIWRGIIGFTLVSVAGFAPWALGLANHIGERGMYGASAMVFIGLSGVALHRLIIGPASLTRFSVLFAAAFVLYSAAWIFAYMRLGGHTGGGVGLAAGTALMGLVFATAFGALAQWPKVMASLFVFNALGYFGGRPIEAAVFNASPIAAMLLWGVCYGVGFGAGLGLAFYFCQSEVRALLRVLPVDEAQK